jgi:hypothetical protein
MISSGSFANRSLSKATFTWYLISVLLQKRGAADSPDRPVNNELTSDGIGPLAIEKLRTFPDNRPTQITPVLSWKGFAGKPVQRNFLPEVVSSWMCRVTFPKRRSKA